MSVFRTLVVLFGVLFESPALSEQTIYRDDLLGVFEHYQTQGTFALLDVETKVLNLVAASRAQQQYIPASTFKIVNSLIALESAAVRDENEIIPYGGAPQRIKAWEANMSMRDAIRISNVPVYQEIARRIGLENYSEFLRRFGFGNEQVGQNVETFWLNGPLKISAIEYVTFLAKMSQFRLPMRLEHQQKVADIIFLETKNDAYLFGKTGWTTAPDPDIGWFVGWVKRDDSIWTFALNIDMNDQNDARKRIEITKSFLALFDVY